MQALALASEGECRQARGLALYVRAKVSAMKGRIVPALRDYFSALREFEWSGDKLALARTNREIGRIYARGGLYDKALDYYDKCHSDLAGSAPPDEYQAYLEDLSAACLGAGRFERAVSILSELRMLYEEKGDKEEVTGVLSQMAACYEQLGKYDLSLESNLAAVDVANDAGDVELQVLVLNNTGYSYKYLGEYEPALDYFTRALSLREAKPSDPADLTMLYTNIAIVRQNLGQHPEAMHDLLKALDLARKEKLTQEEARIGQIMAWVYFLQGDLYNAGIFNRAALVIAEKEGLDDLRMNGYLTSSRISTALYDFELAMGDYRKYLALRDSMEFITRVQQQELAQQQYTVERTEKEIEELIAAREIQGLEVKQMRLAAEKRQQEVELLRKTSELQESIITNQELEKASALQELLLAEEKLAAERKDREIQDLKLGQQLQESELRRRELEQIRQEQEIAVLTKDNELKELSLQKIRTRNKFLAGIVLLSIIIITGIIRMLLYMHKTNRVLESQHRKIQQQKEAIEEQYVIIQREREKSDNLLLNILPRETAAELKEKGTATPVTYDMVTVLFTDFVGFTQVAEKMSAEEVVMELDLCFGEFDRIIDRHNLEKIKTIGDSYMCAGGIPVANMSNPFDVVEAAIEIRDFMNRTLAERNARGESYWELRIGINTGKVVAGVVGKNKFAYDIWGDAVNVASRMESSGEKNRINISGDTYALVRDKYHCIYRGKVHAKNKGEVDMYFVEGRK
jgi:class 3 adenylate cyclase